MSYTTFVLMLIAVLVAACGGGGGGESPPSTAVAGSVPTAANPAPALANPQPVTPPSAEREFEPMLFVGVQAPGESVGYSFGVQNLDAGAEGWQQFSDPACQDSTAFAVDRVGGLVHTVCYKDGKRYTFDPVTKALTLQSPLPSPTTFVPSVACMDGICVFGRGVQSFHVIPFSDGEVVVMQGNETLARLPLPDQNKNRAVYKLGDSEGGVVAVTRGYNWNEVGINRLDPNTQRWQSSCSLAEEIDIGEVAFVGGDVYATVRRNASRPGVDVLRINTRTCAIEREYSVFTQEGWVRTRSVAHHEGKIFVGGGVEARREYGLWRVDAATGERELHLPLTERPQSVVASRKGALFVTQGQAVLEIDTRTLEVKRSLPIDPFGGNLFLVE